MPNFARKRLPEIPKKNSILTTEDGTRWMVYELTTYGLHAMLVDPTYSDRPLSVYFDAFEAQKCLDRTNLNRKNGV